MRIWLLHKTPMRSEPVLPLQTAPIGGYAMSYTEYGSGAPLVLVHGSLSDSRYWKSQMAPLGRSFRVLAVCLRRYWPEAWDGAGDGFSIERCNSKLFQPLQRLKMLCAMATAASKSFSLPGLISICAISVIMVFPPFLVMNAL